MIQEFYIDPKNKSRVNKVQRKGRLKPLKIAEWVLWSLALVALIVTVWSVGFGGGKWLVSNGFYDGLEDEVVIIALSSTFVMCLFGMICRMFFWRFTSVQIHERSTESLIYNKGVLENGYQSLSDTALYGRVIMKIPIGGLERIQYNSSIKKITLTGTMCSIYYGDYVHGITEAKGEEYERQDYIIFDYFTPSLYEFLKQLPENQAKITEE